MLQILPNPFYRLEKATEFKCVLSLNTQHTHIPVRSLFFFLLDTEHKGEKAEQCRLVTLICTDLSTLNPPSSLDSIQFLVGQTSLEFTVISRSRVHGENTSETYRSTKS